MFETNLSKVLFHWGVLQGQFFSGGLELPPSGNSGCAQHHECSARGRTHILSWQIRSQQGFVAQDPCGHGGVGGAEEVHLFVFLGSASIAIDIGVMPRIHLGQVKVKFTWLHISLV